jgi:ankyrin repeat protein
MIAAHTGDDDLVSLILGYGASVDLRTNDGQSALMVASQSRSSKTVERLLAAGAGVNLQTSDGASALMGAAHTGDALICQALLAGGAEPGLAMKGEDGGTAQELAERAGHHTVAAILSDAMAKDL